MANTVFDKWVGDVRINGNSLDSIDFATISGAVSIHLTPKGFIPKETPKENEHTEQNTDISVYQIKVRAWMTKPDSEFLIKWNNNNPMPLRIMVGTIDKRTEKMVHMQLHGDIIQEITQTCMCCGKPITNEISKYFGMGPICGKHNYTNPFGSVEELKAAVADYRVKLQEITWEGWIPQSAIEEFNKQ